MTLHLLNSSAVSCQDHLDLFSTRVKMSAYANPFIELALVLEATLKSIVT